MVGRDHPLHRREPRADGQGCAEEGISGDRQNGEERTTDEDAGDGVGLLRDPLGPTHQPGHRTPTEAGQDAHEDGSEHVAGLDPGEQCAQLVAVDPDQAVLGEQGSVDEVEAQPAFGIVEERDHRVGADDVDVGDVARGRGQQRGDQRPSGDVVPVRGLEGEQDAGGRRLEHGCDTGGRTGGEQDPDVLTPEPAPEAVVDGQSCRGTHVDGRALETEGASESDGGNPGQELGGKVSQRQARGSLVVHPDELVRGGRAQAPTRPTEDEGGE